MLVEVAVEVLAEQHNMHPAEMREHLHNSGSEQIYHDFNYLMYEGSRHAIELMTKHLIPPIRESR